ncbi:T9SS type A sorting domain-containing protein [Hymenobacter sp. B81]|uniref:T9SS type A sorting domain-containing protein n=1 Tax=Hymenobacter sp. B81 TaxID=3344878 RepID=UPI0037DD37CB
MLLLCRLLAFCALLLAVCPVQGQVTVNWVRNLTGPAATGVYDAAFAPGGELYTVGHASGTVSAGGSVMTPPPSSQLGFIVKYDAGGNQLWQKTLPSLPGGQLQLSRLAFDGTGQLLVAGSLRGQVQLEGRSYHGSAEGVAFVARYNAAGTCLGGSILGDTLAGYAETVVDVVGRADGRLYVLTSAYNTDEGLTISRLLSYGAAGNLLFSQTVASGSLFQLHLAVTDAGVQVLGNFDDNSTVNGTAVTLQGEANFFLARYSLAGQPLGVRYARSSGNISAVGMSPDAQGNLYLTGLFSGPGSVIDDTALVPYDALRQPYTVFVAKFDANHNLLWTRAAGGGGGGGSSNGIRGDFIHLDAGGNYWIAGAYMGAATVGGHPLAAVGSLDLFMAGFSPSGTPLSVFSTGSTKLDRLTAFDMRGPQLLLAGDYGDDGTGTATIPFGPLSLTTSDPGADGFVAQLMNPVLLAAGPPRLLSKLAVYPNPATAQLNVQLPTELAQIAATSLALTNAVGQQVQRWELGSTVPTQVRRYDVSQLPGGVYLLLLQDGAGRTLAQQRVLLGTGQP